MTQTLFTGVLLSIFAVFFGFAVFVIGPEYESRLFPITKDMKIALISEDRTRGIQEFRIEARKVRSCDIVAIKVISGDSKEGLLRLSHFSLKDNVSNRPRGHQVYEGFVIGEPANYIRVDTVHRCHSLWNTVTSPWGEWQR